MMVSAIVCDTTVSRAVCTATSLSHPSDEALPKDAATHFMTSVKDGSCTLKLKGNGADFTDSTGTHGVDVTCHNSSMSRINN